MISDAEHLLTDGWQPEVHIPAKERGHPRKASLLVCPSTEKYEDLQRGEGLPKVKLVIPES